MKVAILAESEVDEAAIGAFAKGVLGGPFDLYLPSLRARGVDALLRSLPALIKHLHYQTDVDGLIVVADSDRTTVHQPTHSPAIPDCRYCDLQTIIGRVRSNLPAGGRSKPLRIAVGVPVPAIEAWYLGGVDPHVNEAAWSRNLGGVACGYDPNSLKSQVYGSRRAKAAVRPAQEKAAALASAMAERLDRLAELFPGGFAPLLAELRSWVVGG